MRELPQVGELGPLDIYFAEPKAFVSGTHFMFMEVLPFIEDFAVCFNMHIPAIQEQYQYPKAVDIVIGDCF